MYTLEFKNSGEVINFIRLFTDGYYGKDYLSFVIVSNKLEDACTMLYDLQNTFKGVVRNLGEFCSYRLGNLYIDARIAEPNVLRHSNYDIIISYMPNYMPNLIRNELRLLRSKKKLNTML